MFDVRANDYSDVRFVLETMRPGGFLIPDQESEMFRVLSLAVGGPNRRAIDLPVVL